jgi:hypothetical protein
LESKARLVSCVKNSDKWVAPKLTATTVNKNILTVTGIGTFILDFQTTNFDDDSKIVMKMLYDYRVSVHGETHNPQNQEYYTLDRPDQVLDGLLPSYLLPDSSLKNYTRDILIGLKNQEVKKSRTNLFPGSQENLN